MPARSRACSNRVRTAPAPRALPDQPGGAGAVGERPAGRRRRPEPDARTRPACANSWPAQARSWSISACSSRRARQRASVPPTRRRELGRPWLLDPVKVELSARRLDLRPATAPAPAGRGARQCRRDRRPCRRQAMPRPWRGRRAASSARTGARDLVTDGTRAVTLGNGSELMDRVTAVGCAASALTGAFLAVEPDAWAAAAAALLVMGVAGEHRGRARARARQLRRRAPGRALPARRGHPDRARAASHEAGPRSAASMPCSTRRAAAAARRPSWRPPPRAAGPPCSSCATSVRRRRLRRRTRLRGPGGAGAVRPAAADQRPGRRGAGGRRRGRASRSGRHGARPMPRRLLGPAAIVGATVHHASEADAAGRRRSSTMPASARCSPPSSKADAEAPIGPSGLAALIAAPGGSGRAFPCCGIAGIDHAQRGQP